MVQKFYGWVARHRVVMAMLLMFLVALAPSVAMAQATPGDGGEITVDTVLDVASLRSAVIAIGGAALLAALGVAGGFRLAKKAFSWTMNKI